MMTRAHIYVISCLAISLSCAANAGPRGILGKHIVRADDAATALGTRSGRETLESAAERRFRQNIVDAGARARIAAAGRRAERAADLTPGQSARAQFGHVQNPSIIYRRTDPSSDNIYVGQSTDTATYLNRQRQHNRAQGVDHRFEVLGTTVNRSTAPPASASVKPNTPLRVAEETGIRYFRGQSDTATKVANRRYEMNDKAFVRNGGTEPKPAQSATPLPRR